MISKITSAVPKYTEKVSNKCNALRSCVNESSLDKKITAQAKQKTANIGSYLLNKIKSAAKSLNKFFSEEGRSKRAGIDPLTEKEREKFIRETSIYDPNSPDYIHASYSRPKKSK